VPGSNEELERLKRLRERQLTDRDPLIKQRQFQRSSAQREKKLKKPYPVSKMWKDIPHAWKGFFYGLVLGTAVFILVPMFWLSPWAFPCSVTVIVVLALFGVVLGRAIDTREEIKELIR
jgi:hypothetical protein